MEFARTAYLIALVLYSHQKSAHGAMTVGEIRVINLLVLCIHHITHYELCNYFIQHTKFWLHGLHHDGVCVYRQQGKYLYIVASASSKFGG